MSLNVKKIEDMLDDFVSALKTIKPFGIKKEISFEELKRKKISVQNVESETDEVLGLSNVSIPNSAINDNIAVSFETVVENNDFFDEVEEYEDLIEEEPIEDIAEENFVSINVLMVDNNEIKDKTFETETNETENKEEKVEIQDEEENITSNSENKAISVTANNDSAIDETENYQHEGYQYIETKNKDAVLKALEEADNIDNDAYEEISNKEEDEKEKLIDGSNIPIKNIKDNAEDISDAENISKNQSKNEIEELNSKIEEELEETKNKFIEKYKKEAKSSLDDLIKEKNSVNINRIFNQKNKKTKQVVSDEDLDLL